MDELSAVARGVMEKIEARQTTRVAVDLRGVSQTPADLRAALQAYGQTALQEVIALTRDGLTRAFP